VFHFQFRACLLGTGGAVGGFQRLRHDAVSLIEPVGRLGAVLGFSCRLQAVRVVELGLGPHTPQVRLHPGSLVPDVDPLPGALALQVGIATRHFRSAGGVVAQFSRQVHALQGLLVGRIGVVDCGGTQCEAGRERHAGIGPSTQCFGPPASTE